MYCFVAAYMANKDNGGESIFNSQMKHKISVWSESDFHMTVTQACTFTVGTHCQQLLSFNISSSLLLLVVVTVRSRLMVMILFAENLKINLKMISNSK